MYYFTSRDGIITSAGELAGRFSEISAEKYETISEMLENKPTAEPGYDYRLTESLEWELFKVIPDEEIKDIPEEEAVQIITGEVTE